MICPPSIVANRRSLATRIAVTRGTASLRIAGIGPRWTAKAAGRTAAAGGGVRTTPPASSLSAEGAGGFRAGAGRGSGTEDRGSGPGCPALDPRSSTLEGGTLTAGGFDFEADAGALTAGGVTRGAGGVAITPGAGALASVEGATGAFGFGVFGDGIVTSGCTRLRGTVFVAFTGAGLGAGGFALGTDGFDSGPFAGTLTAGGGALTEGGFGFGGGGFGSGLFAGSPAAGAGARTAGGVALSGVTGTRAAGGGLVTAGFAGTRGSMTRGRGSVPGCPAGALVPFPTA